MVPRHRDRPRPPRHGRPARPRRLTATVAVASGCLFVVTSGIVAAGVGGPVGPVRLSVPTAPVAVLAASAVVVAGGRRYAPPTALLRFVLVALTGAGVAGVLVPAVVYDTTFAAETPELVFPLAVLLSTVFLWVDGHVLRWLTVHR